MRRKKPCKFCQKARVLLVLMSLIGCTLLMMIQQSTADKLL